MKRYSTVIVAVLTALVVGVLTYAESGLPSRSSRQGVTVNAPLSSSASAGGAVDLSLTVPDCSSSNQLHYSGGGVAFSCDACTEASASVAGCVGTGAQTIAGEKTLTGKLTIADGGFVVADGLTSIFGGTLRVDNDLGLAAFYCNLPGDSCTLLTSFDGGQGTTEAAFMMQTLKAEANFADDDTFFRLGVGALGKDLYVASVGGNHTWSQGVGSNNHALFYRDDDGVLYSGEEQAKGAGTSLTPVVVPIYVNTAMVAGTTYGADVMLRNTTVLAIRGRIRTAGSGGTTNAVVRISDGTSNCDCAFACNTAAGGFRFTCDNTGGACDFSDGGVLTYTANSIGDCSPGPDLQGNVGIEASYRAFP